MRMIICSLSELRKRHEVTKEYECCNYLAETQKNIMDNMKKAQQKQIKMMFASKVMSMICFN